MGFLNSSFLYNQNWGLLNEEVVHKNLMGVQYKRGDQGNMDAIKNAHLKLSFKEDPI